MRYFIMVIFATFLLCATMMAQDHIVVPHDLDHTGRICYGYATGRAAGRSSSDANCNPNSLYQETINQTFFTWNEGGSLTGVQSGDIIRFSDHAAYATSINSGNMGQSTVDHTAAAWSTDSIGSKLVNVINQFGNPTGYYRRKTFAVTVQNSFGAGTIKVNSGIYSSGASVNLGWTTTHTLEAINQNYQAPSELNYFRVFQSWEKNGSGDGSTNPKSITVDAAVTYEAVFLKRFDVTFQNSLPGASGGQIEVAGVNQSAPHNAQVIQNQSISAEGLYQVINQIEYTFSSWTSGSSPFTPSDHTTYTANYNAKPLHPSNVAAGGDVDDPVEITWTEHPHDSVTQYQIWRKIKPLGQGEGSPELVATVNRGTTSYIDYTCVVTSGYTHDLVSYDVRAYFSVNSTYSDPNYVAVFADLTPVGRVKDEDRVKVNALTALPTEFAVSSHPNPFNPSTTISYQLSEEANVVLHVFDMMGREVISLVNDRKNAGYHSIAWQGKDSRGINVASGTYFYRFTASPLSGNEPFIRSGKLLLTK